MARECTLEELLKASFQTQMNKIYTAMPCTVVGIHDNLEELRIDVQPSLDFFYQDKTSKPRSVILNIPVMFPATSTSALTMPVNTGDNVMCLFSMRAMEIFNESDGKPSVPNNHAKFNKKDAVAIVGLFPRKNSINNPRKRRLPHNTKDTVLSHNIGKANEVEIRLKEDGSLIINSPNKVIVNAPEAEINSSTSVIVNSPTSTFNGDMVVNGDINSTGTITGDIDVIGGGKSLKTHTHIGSPTAPVGGVSPTGVPN